MKFTCPNCSAKYQIADEKVAGRTVKMKCRKCGTMIPIRAPTRQSIAAAPLVSAQSLAPSVPGKSFVAPAVAPPPHTEVEWHAGINGQAIGPMTRKELERRVREGSVNAETFVWHEGMDGWKQVPDVAELAGLLDERDGAIAPPPPSMPAQAKAQALRPLPRPSLGPSPSGGLAAVGAQPLPRPSAPPKPATPRPAAIKPSRPTPAIGIPAMAALRVATPAPAEQAKAVETPSPVAPAGDWDAVLDDVGGSGAAGGVAAGAVRAAPPVQEAPIPHIDMPTHEHSSGGSIRPSYESLVMQLRKRRKNPYVIPFAIVAALVLGVTVGFVLFGDQETKIVRQIVEVPSQVKGAMEEREAAREIIKEAEEDEKSPDTPTNAKVASKTGSSSANSGTATTSKPAEVKGLQGLSGLEGLGGPSGGPAGPSGSTAGGQELSSSQIQSTVSQYQNSVKRGCWEKALMTRDKDAPSSARVTVSIKVAPGGNVTSATSSGDPRGYSGLSSCITSRVRNWTFPRSSGSTTVNVPFVFAAQ